MAPRKVTLQTLAKMNIGNAAGLVSTPGEIERACGNNGMTEITIGPITLNMRPGNTGATYAYDPETGDSTNSIGLKNMGWPWYLEHIRKICGKARILGKRVRASIVGLAKGEFGKLAQLLRYAGVDEIELNLGCPNLWNPDGTQKPILSYDPAAVKAVLDEVRSAIGNAIPIAVKISPVPDDILVPLVDTILASGIVTRVVAVNTLPNVDLIIDGKHALRFKPDGASEESPWLHTGGGGGEQLRPHRRRITRYLADRLPYGMGITAVGAIFTGADALECLEDDADSIQLGTAYREFDGPHAIDRVLKELAELVNE